MIRWAARLGCVATLIAVASAGPARAAALPGFLDMVTDSARIFSVPTVARPAYLNPVTDPTFGTRVTRVAGNAGTAIGGGVSGTWSADARHHYSKDQPWNSDGTLLAIDNDGTPSLVLLDGETYAPRKGRCSGYSRSDDRWHPSPAHPNERINVNGSELMWYDVVNCVKTRTWTLPFSVSYLGMGEGNPSFDGRFVALSNGSSMFVVDMDPQPPFAPYPAVRIGPPVRIDECGLSGCAVDWMSISASGKYVLVSYDGDYPRVFDVNPTTLALTPRPMPASAPRCHGTAEKGFVYDLGHADLTMNPFDANEDVLIGQEHCGNRGRTVDGKLLGSVVMVRLRDGAITPLTDPANEAYAHHISTRNYDRPGWVYVGYHAESGKKYSQEVIAVKLDGSKSVQRFAHFHTDRTSCYRCEAHAVPSRDGRRALWASNWMLNCSTCGTMSDIKPYVVDARNGAVVVDDVAPGPSFVISR